MKDGTWVPDPEGLPPGASLPDRLEHALAWAVLAPSGHNSQPWLFRVGADHVDVLADRRRALPVVDPADRELTMSCGAALLNTRLALAGLGLATDLAVLPSPGDPDHLARVTVRGPAAPDADTRALFEAIPRRHTCRARFEAREIPGDVLLATHAAADREGTWLLPVTTPRAKRDLAELIARGDRVQGAEPSFRRELAAWVHPNRTRSRDGIPGFAFGVGDLASLAGPLVLRTFDWDHGQAARDRELAEGSPALLVLGTAEDTPAAWLAAGQALQRVLLTLTHHGLVASFLNQPIEVDHLRDELRQLLDTGQHPQILLRVGYGPPGPPTPRRPVADVLVRG